MGNHMTYRYPDEKRKQIYAQNLDLKITYFLNLTINKAFIQSVV